MATPLDKDPEVIAWLKEKKVGEVIDAAVIAMVKERPANIHEYLAKYHAKMADTRAAAAAAMASAADSGFDVIIVCCSGTIEASYWQRRLEASKGHVISSSAKVYSVDEDWNGGGAGNGLGTLYAYKKAVAAATKDGVDINAKISSGEWSIGMYHTAGKGTRLAPLPGSENNNKPGVKLPAAVELQGGKTAPITILEAVIKQTAAYASSRKGRLSVFWGDQVFIPSVPAQHVPTAHADLLAQLCKTMPSAEDWKAKGLGGYGLAVLLENGEGVQIEKVDHATALQYTSGLGPIKTVGPSLGSFSVSSQMLTLLSDEYKAELEKREGQLDSDPDFWMPMTLPKEAYCQLMGKKKVDAAVSDKQWERMREMLKRLDKKGLAVFGAVDAGEDAYWWDYGQLPYYMEANLRLTKDGAENDAYRTFFQQPRGQPKDSTVASGVSVDAMSSVVSCELLESGAVKASSLCGVTTAKVDADRCILVNVTAKEIKAGEGSIVYNVVEDGVLEVGPGQVLTTVFAEDGKQVRMQCPLKTDGKEAWSKVLPGNEFSFEQIHKNNKGVDPHKCEQMQFQAHDAVAAKLGSKRRRGA